MQLRHRLMAAGLLAALLAVPVMAGAGGPFQPPDGVGNPTGRDYTGYHIHGWAVGVKDTPLFRTRIMCANFGLLKADAVAVQFYRAVAVSDPNRSPTADTNLPGLELAEVDWVDSDGAFGSVSKGFGLARILVKDSAPRLNPAIQCTAQVLEKATDNLISTLDVLRPAPPKKKKRRRR